MAKISKKTTEVIEIQRVVFNEITFNCLGTSPLIMERFQQKAWQELLFPSAPKNLAERAQSMKHDPIGEFRGAVYRCRDPKAATFVHVPNGAFHGALANAALDIPGTTKSKIERLTRVIDVTVHLYGVPHIFCAMVRNSDMARTPDVRTRPIFPQWACRVSVKYATPQLTERSITHLFAAAGMIIGIGGWRGEKGGPFGAWELVADNNTEFKQVLKQSRAAQVSALEKPIFYDEDTEELLTWFEAEVIRRERSVASSAKTPGSKSRRGRIKKTPKGAIYVEDGDGNLLGKERN